MKESALVPSTSQIVEKPKRILSAELEKIGPIGKEMEGVK